MKLVNVFGILLLSLMLGLHVAGCGDDDGDTTPSDAGDGDGATTGDGDGATTGDGDGATTGDGDGPTTGDGDGPGGLADCDTDIPTTATCGGTDCPESPAAMLCGVPCCVDDACGVRSAIVDATTECQVPPAKDPSCPDYSGMASLDGCCMPDDTCGFISTLSGMCINTSMFLTDLAGQAGEPCGDVDGGVEDEDAGN